MGVVQFDAIDETPLCVTCAKESIMSAYDASKILSHSDPFDEGSLSKPQSLPAPVNSSFTHFSTDSGVEITEHEIPEWVWEDLLRLKPFVGRK
jgi:hypothetical protein